MFPLAFTFFASAYWHGFYFGYYAFFLGLGSMDFLWKTFPKTSLAVWLKSVVPQPCISVFKWVFTFVIISYSGMSFYFLAVEPIVEMWSSFYFLGHLIRTSLILLSFMLPKAVSDSSKKPK